MYALSSVFHGEKIYYTLQEHNKNKKIKRKNIYSSRYLFFWGKNKVENPQTLHVNINNEFSMAFGYVIGVVITP